MLLRSFDVVPDPRTLFLPANQARPPPALAAGPCVLTMGWASPSRVPLTGVVWQLLRAAGLDVVIFPWRTDPSTMRAAVRLAAPIGILALLDHIQEPLKRAGYPLAGLHCEPISEAVAAWYTASLIGCDLAGSLSSLVRDWLASRQGRL